MTLWPKKFAAFNKMDSHSGLCISVHTENNENSYFRVILKVIRKNFGAHNKVPKNANELSSFIQTSL